MLEAQELIHIVGLGGEHDNRHIGELPDLLAGLEPVHPGHHQIQDHQIHRLAGGNLHRLHAVRAGQHLIAFVFQIEFNPLDQELFVVYHQNFHGISSTQISFSTAA